MKNEVIQTDYDMPQLRQMVLENTARIDRNELMIEHMRKENDGQARKADELNEWLRNSSREHDRWARRMRETLDEIAQITKRSQIAQEKRNRELDARFAETDRQIKETDRQLREQKVETDRQLMEQKVETDRQLMEQKVETDRLLMEQKAETDRLLMEQKAETDRQLRETSLEVKRLSRQLSGTTGHIVEGLVSSSTEKVFQKAGFNLHNSGKNLKRSLPSEHIAMEVDVLLSNEDIAIPIEVKTNCTKEDIHRFLHQMGHFRRLFPEYDGKEVLAAVAAINYEKDVVELARKEKLLVIRVNSDDIFSIDPFKKEDLGRF